MWYTTTTIAADPASEINPNAAMPTTLCGPAQGVGIGRAARGGPGVWQTVGRVEQVGIAEVARPAVRRKPKQSRWQRVNTLINRSQDWT